MSAVQEQIADRHTVLEEQLAERAGRVAGFEGELQRLTPQLLLSYLGKPDAVLRSGAGKDYNHYVYPNKGLAFSANAREVAYLEIFAPTSLEAYESQFYFEPPAFVR